MAAVGAGLVTRATYCSSDKCFLNRTFGADLLLEFLDGLQITFILTMKVREAEHVLAGSNIQQGNFATPGTLLMTLFRLVNKVPFMVARSVNVMRCVPCTHTSVPLSTFTFAGRSLMMTIPSST